MKLNAKLIRTVLKLTWFEELGQRGIADAAGVGKTTVLAHPEDSCGKPHHCGNNREL